jgi:MinD-like ATPase involved in chromosome partitioning or flagellar assembly
MPKRSFDPGDGGDRHDEQPAVSHRLPPLAGPRMPVRSDPPPVRLPTAHAPAAELTDRTVVRARPQPPVSGWRRVLHAAGGGRVATGDSAAGRTLRDREARVRRVLAAPHRIAVVSLKGGVGKTTVTACVGLAMAELRGDRVAVLDADPDAGTLADRLTGESTVSVRDLAVHAHEVRALPDLDRFTSLSGRLQVLASDQDPARDDAVGRIDHDRAAAVLARFCDVVITDSGPGVAHPVVAGTLAAADSLVVVGSPTVDGAGRAARTLDVLRAHGWAELVQRSVVVLSGAPAHPRSDIDALRERLRPRCRALVDLPHDPHLAAGGRIRLAALRPPAAAAVLEVAALLADEFGATPPVHRDPLHL